MHQLKTFVIEIQVFCGTLFLKNVVIFHCGLRKPISNPSEDGDGDGVGVVGDNGDD